MDSPGVSCPDATLAPSVFVYMVFAITLPAKLIYYEKSLAEMGSISDPLLVILISKVQTFSFSILVICRPNAVHLHQQSSVRYLRDCLPVDREGDAGYMAWEHRLKL